MAGQKGKSGRKARFEYAKISDLLDKSWPAADRRAVIRSLHGEAKDGNVQAASLLLSYAYGKPTERHEHSFDLSGLTDEELCALEPIVRKLTRP